MAVFLSGESHGWKSLVGYNPWGPKRVRHDLAAKQQGARCTLRLVLGAHPMGLDKWHVPSLVSNKYFNCPKNFGGHLSCSFICWVFLCLFILFKLLILGCPFCILAVCEVLFIVAFPRCVLVCTGGLSRFPG